VATRVLTHNHRQDRMLEWFQARTVEISTSVPLPREVDGEVITQGHGLTVTVAPKALVVRVPAGSRHRG
jgi:diacylglycerol kinase family enzyme